MLDTSSWERRMLSVQDDLHLDPRNVRLELASAQVEADIIEDLFNNEGALDLVDAIAKVGYLTHEVPVAVERDSKWVVAEGNRRLAALKAIQNPLIVPGHQSRIRSLVQTMGSTRDKLTNIEVLIAPSQDDADQVIAALHTSNPRKSWSPARQAAFFQAQINSGRTFQELLARYPTVDVASFVLRAHLVNRLKEAVSDDAELLDFVGSSEWKKGYSALTRIFDSRHFREVTGVKLDNSGRLTTTLDDESFNDVARIIVEGMYDRSITTRTINTVKSPRFTALISEMREAVNANPSAMGNGVPDGRREREDGHAGSRTPPATIAEAAPEPSRPNGVPSAGRTRAAKNTQKKRKTPFLATGHLVAHETYPIAVRLHLEELSRLNYRRLPNTTFLALRAILEKSIKAYAEAKEEDIKSKNSQKGFVQLYESLTWLAGYFRDNGKRELVQPTQRILSGKIMNYTNTNDSLNAINHNHNFSVDPDEVENLWNSVDPIIRELMKP